MAGASFTVEIDDRAVKAALNRLARAGRDMRPMFDEIGGLIETATLLRFERGESPEGVPWKPSRRALRQGGKTLVDTGRLRDSITRQATRDSVVVGTNVIYAAIHQFGGKTGRGLAVDMPARPYLGVSEDDRRGINEIAADFIEEAWR